MTDFILFALLPAYFKGGLENHFFKKLEELKYSPSCSMRENYKGRHSQLLQAYRLIRVKNLDFSRGGGYNIVNSSFLLPFLAKDRPTTCIRENKLIDIISRIRKNFLCDRFAKSIPLILAIFREK
jgi:hypothetical protein